MTHEQRFLVCEHDVNASTMRIPVHHSLMLFLMRIAAEGKTRVDIAADVIADQFGLSEDDREELSPSGKQRRLDNRVQWAKFYMSKAGLLDSLKRGVFYVG